MASAADELVTVQPGRVIERRLTFSKDDLRTMPLLWVQAHPERIVVSVVSPDGTRYSGANRNPGAPIEVQYADAKSNSEDEIFLAGALGSDATLVSWNENALPGIYTIRLMSEGLSSPMTVTLRQMIPEDIQKEVEAKEKRQGNEILASASAAPEKRTSIGPQGTVKLTFQGAWQKDDVILIGSTLAEGWSASVQFPEGHAITEANAGQLGCEWTDSDRGDARPFTPFGAEFAIKIISCPKLMQSGVITVEVRARGNSAGQAAASIFRPSALEAVFEKELNDFPPVRQTIQLVHKSEDPNDNGYLSTITDRPVVIHLALQGGTSPIADAGVTGIEYTVNRRSDYPLRVIGPDPAKTRSGVVSVQRESNGDFASTFSGHEPGTHQLDFRVDGHFTNGRRFAAEAAITVFVHRKAASLTRVRQQRFDQNKSGKVDLVRFLLDLDVSEPGPYDAYIQVGKEPNQRYSASGQQILATGKQTMVVEGDENFVAKLQSNPDAQLDIRVNSRNRSKDEEFRSEVAIDIAIPRAGEFEPSGNSRQ